MSRKCVERPRPAPAAVTSPPRPSIGLALGGGGARGLAHIVMLEAFDELGIRPKVISGTSIGAIMGAAYASGMSGAQMRAHTKYILSQRFAVMRDFFAARPLQKIRELFPGTSALLDPSAVLDVIMPKQTKPDFESLDIPLKIVASDYYNQEQQVFTQGPLGVAVAASMALPAIFQPVLVGGKAMVDGGLTNPLPYDLLEGEADIIVAIDVSGAPVPDPRRPYPTAMESLFASAFLFERTIVREKLKNGQPDILISAGTQRFQLLDILKVDDILATAEPAKERLKAKLERVLSVETLAQIPSPAGEPTPASEAQREPRAVRAKPRRGLLSRRKSRKRRPDA
ncbi:MAG TPA: patatin-like phospholipase family protein [Hyphomicrobium sp.]|nr:patatin-like phospholipase family protein [Hyphomicrobium sp.]